MTVSSSYTSFILIVVLNVVQGTLTPNGNVSVDCGSTWTFTCSIPGELIKWTTSGLSGISRGPFLARNEAYRNPRIMSPDTGETSQGGMSVITISGFSRSDNGGTVRCINAKNNNIVWGMASISVGLRAPIVVVAKAESCDNITLHWTQLGEPNDITTSVSCTPPSPGCADCTTSPCTITGLNPSTEYVFTVTLNSVMCGTFTNTTAIRTRGLRAPTNVVATVQSCDTVILQWTQPSRPNDITTSVSCTPPSPGCAGCTTSPCTITGLTPSTEYEFTVTLSNQTCGTTMSRTRVRTNDAEPCITFNSAGTAVGSSAPLAALVLLLLLTPLIYPLGVLIAKYCCFRDKSYCEVFWCGGYCRKDKSARCNSTEITTSPHPKEEKEYQNVNKGQHIQLVTDEEENKDQIGNNQERIVTYETVEQLGDDDGDVITDETVVQQGYEDWITYADLDFSGHSKGNVNVIHKIADEVPYAAV